jgi:hypothetical protein
MSGCLGFQVVSDWVGSGSGQFDFLKKSDRIGFEFGRIGRIFRIGSDFITSTRTRSRCQVQIELYRRRQMKAVQVYFL